jgi:drug/metabolite transporter (DMT)-like permease
MRSFSPRALVALGSLYVIWGSTYLAIAIGIETLPPLAMAGARFVVAGGVMCAFAWHRLQRRPTSLELRNAAIVGTGLCLGGNGLVTLAEQRIASGTAALIVATVPLWLTGLDRVFFGVRLSRMTVGGLIAGFAGTALLVRPGGASDTLGAFLVVAAAFLWASASLFARRTPAVSSPSVNVGLQMVFGGIASLVAATAVGEWSDLDIASVSLASTVAWLYLIAAGSIVGFSAYVYLLRNVPTHVTGTYAYVNPVIAVILGAVILDEALDVWTLVAGGIVCASVAAIIIGGRRPTAGAVPLEPVTERA